MPTSSPLPLETPQPNPDSDATQQPQTDAIRYAYTYQQPDGNRIVYGKGTLPQIEPIDIQLAGLPAWIVGVTGAEGSIWAVVLEDGTVQFFEVLDKGFVSMAQGEHLPVGMPPLLRVKDGLAQLVTLPAQTDASPLTHPVPLDDSGRLAFISKNGDVVIWEGGEVERFAIDALPDARLLTDNAGRLLVLSGATKQYDHGVLGDAVEATSITLIDMQDRPRLVKIINAPQSTVIEGIAPIWADINGDGSREITITVSNATQGAQVLSYDESGQQIAAGPAIGQGYRWRHQIAATAFGPDGSISLVDVLTPHIGGIVEFYRLQEGELEVIAEMPGYTSHVIRTRNLDLAAAGDFDGDGMPELLLPNQARMALGAVQLTDSGAEVSWTLPAGGSITTNLAAVTTHDNQIAVGIGRSDGVLRLWLP